MSSSTRPPTNPNPNAPAPSTNGGGADHSYFEEMRGELVREIAVVSALLFRRGGVGIGVDED
jgi:hypothetical protein